MLASVIVPELVLPILRSGAGYAGFSGPCEGFLAGVPAGRCQSRRRCKVQRILVTAGASGIGREIAKAFAANGAKVFVCDIDAKGLDALKAETPGLTTGVCDVSK